MGADSGYATVRTRARARTESAKSPLIKPVLAPPQTLKATQRERSSSYGTTFVSTAVVPAPDSTEILSSLISSLTVLTDATRDKVPQDKIAEPTISDFPSDALQPDSFVISDSEPESSPPLQFLLDPSDDEVAEPPIVGYARGPVKPAKKSVRERWAAHRAGRNTSETNLNGRNSSQLFRAPGVATGIGVPSIERPPSSAAMSLSLSLNGSRPSLDLSTRGPIKMFIPSKLSEDHAGPGPSRPVIVRDDDTRSTTTTRSKRSAKRLNGVGRSAKPPDVISIPLPDKVIREETKSPATPARKTYNPLDPANRADLGEHLIPSRKSSHKNSPAKSVSTKSSPSRTTKSVRDFKITEEDIIEEEDPTLRRIKELQLAREKRQTDREKENERTEKSRRRPSTANAKLINGDISSNEGVRKTVDTTRKSQDGDIPSMSATVNAVDLGMLPAFTNVAASPTPSPSTPTMPNINLAKMSPVANGRAHAPPPSPMKHKRRFSGSLRRSSSLRRNGSADVNSVSEEVEAHLNAARFSQKLRHPRSGRAITFSEAGDPHGSAVFVCPGMGLTRYITVFYDEVAKAQRLRLITPDRPGSGDSDALPDTTNPAMAWADDIMVICQSLGIQNFSLLAHSAGSVYALATALKMPQFIKGKIHLLAPWIPQSQMAGEGGLELRAANLPTSHKILSILPTGFLKAANSRLLASASAGVESKSKSKKDKNFAAASEAMLADVTRGAPRPLPTPDSTPGRMSAFSQRDTATPQLVSPPRSPSKSSLHSSRPPVLGSRNRMTSPAPTEQLTPQARQALYNRILTDRLWSLSTTKANAAIDLIVCFERKRSIGYFYKDVTRSIVIHHGRLDTRVPLPTVQWLAQVLPRCELRVLDDEEHSLMGNAIVMNNVLTEIGQEWEDWNAANRDNERKRRELEKEIQAREQEQRNRFIKTGRY